MALRREKMLTAVRNQTGVPADLRELMILRVAVLNRASFEFEAHVPHAERAGVVPAKIVAVQELGLSNVFSATEKLLLELTDAMTGNIEVPDAFMERVRAQLTPSSRLRSWQRLLLTTWCRGCWLR